MTKHADGPWQAYLYCGNACIKSADGAHIGYGYGHANAHFIAAAPDFFDFTVAFVKWVEDMPDEDREQIEIDLVAQAKAAIAKAGEGDGR